MAVATYLVVKGNTGDFNSQATSYFVVDTAAELSGIGSEGDTGYAKDTDLVYIRKNAAWVDISIPTAHATTHKSGGTDAIKLDELAAPTDVTTLNASTSAHGLLKKLSNVATEFLNGQGNFTVPAAAAGTGSTDIEVVTGTGGPSLVTPAGTFVSAFELNDGSTQGVACDFRLPAGANLATVDPTVIINFMVTSLGTGNGNVRLQCVARYVANGELVDKAADQTLAQTEGVIDTIKQEDSATFTLSRALIAAGNRIVLEINRLGADGADTFTGKIGIMSTIQFVYGT